MACSRTDSAHGQTVSPAVLRYPSSDSELCVEFLDRQGLFPRSPNSFEVPVVGTVSIQSFEWKKPYPLDHPVNMRGKRATRLRGRSVGLASVHSPTAPKDPLPRDPSLPSVPFLLQSAAFVLL